VGPRAGLNTEARGKIPSPLPGIEPRSPGRPARIQTLYRLSYPAHPVPTNEVMKTESQRYASSGMEDIPSPNTPV
jgi:hypothetical protein